MSVRTEKYLIHPPPAEVAEQAPDASFGALQIDIMAEARLGADTRHAWLPGVDLPGMEIKDRGLTIKARHDGRNRPVRRESRWI